jgi:manganese efflux pump family protein
MDPVVLLGTAVALAMDTLAVAAAISAGLGGLTVRQTFRLTFHFGLFQAAMPAIGWYGGSALAGVLGAVDHYIAFGLLAFLGVRMIRESLRGGDGRAPGAARDPSRGLSLVGLSIATSIDALAVGISLGLLGKPILVPALVIGLVCSSLTFVGTLLGRRVGPSLGRWSGRVGGLVLILIGAKILIEHLGGF